MAIHIWNEVNKTSKVICDSHKNVPIQLSKKVNNLISPLNIHICHTWAYGDGEHDWSEESIGYRWLCLHNRWLIKRIYSMWPLATAKLIPCASCPTHCVSENERSTQNCPTASRQMHIVVSKPSLIYFHSTFVKVFYGRAAKPRGAMVWKDLSLLIEY